MTQQVEPKIEPLICKVGSSKNLREVKQDGLRRNAARIYLLDLLLKREFHLANFMAWNLFLQDTIYKEDLRYVVKITAESFMGGCVDINQN